MRVEIIALRGLFTTGCSRLWPPRIVHRIALPFRPLAGGVSICERDLRDLDTALDGETVAALIVEPIQGEGGVRSMPISSGVFARWRGAGDSAHLRQANAVSGAQDPFSRTRVSESFRHADAREADRRRTAVGQFSYRGNRGDDPAEITDNLRRGHSSRSRQYVVDRLSDQRS
jgi:hypothetical protein